jgi:site-specific DNA-methyltransferase (adenine-specific)
MTGKWLYFAFALLMFKNQSTSITSFPRRRESASLLCPQLRLLYFYLMNHLYFGDCLDVLKQLKDENPQPFIDLIYIDPPFNSKRNYNVLFESMDMKDATAQKEAFADTWSNYSYVETLNEISLLDRELYTVLKTFHDLKSVNDSAVAYLTTMAIRIWYMHKLLKDTGSFYLHCDPTMSHYLS